MSDDDVIGPDDLDSEILSAPELDGDELDVDALEIDGLEEDGFAVEEGADIVDDPDEIPLESASKKVADDDDDDDDLRTEDDVEADLDAILREKLTAADDSPPEEDEEDVVVDDKTDGMERLQPRRPDEKQCTQCFLLVRNSAPGCPVEDDACPLFK